MSMIGTVGQLASGITPAPLGALDTTLLSINTSPYFTASMMLLLNLGGRFLGLELSKGQEQFFMHPYFRRFLIFIVIFVATRNVAIAFWMTIVIILLIGYLFNENSSLCLMPGGLPGSRCNIKESFVNIPGLPPSPTATSSAASAAATGHQSGLTPEEENILKMLLDKKQRGETKAAADKIEKFTEAEQSTKSGKNLLEHYAKNMKLLGVFN